MVNAFLRNLYSSRKIEQVLYETFISCGYHQELNQTAILLKILEGNACNMSLAKTIKQIREQKEMLQKQVAAELNIGTTNYNKLEYGNREPTVKQL